MLQALVALLGAFVIGFTAQRASLCNVRAVSDVLDRRDFSMFSALLQAVAWSAIAAGLLVTLGGVRPATTSVHLTLELAALGGLLFGVGAAVNGGCSLSTLHRLVNGELSMLGTLAGVALGGLAVGAASSVLDSFWLVSSPSPWLRWPSESLYVLLALLAWGSWRGWRLLRSHQASQYSETLRSILWPHYHLPLAALVLGLTAGALYTSEGAWTYSSLLRELSFFPWRQEPKVSSWHVLLVLVVIAGAVASAWQRKSFALRRVRSLVALARHAAAGTLMGAGAALVPGGNDTLLLVSLPAGTTSALVAYISLLVGIATTLVVLKRLSSPMPPLDRPASDRLPVVAGERQPAELRLVAASAQSSQVRASCDPINKETAWPSCTTPATSHAATSKPT